MTAPVHRWLCDPADPEVRARIHRWSNADDVRHLAVMPDVHPAGDFCVGMVIGTEQLVYPCAVGGDIGCGIAACRFSPEWMPAMRSHFPAVYAEIRREIPIYRHRRGDQAAAPAELPPVDFDDPRLQALLHADGMLQLGTLGSGNHFAELQIDEENRLWAMVHSGSRGLGQAIYQHHVRNCRRTRTGLAALDASASNGQAYLADVASARSYAATNRRAMLAALARVVCRILGLAVDADSYTDCDHNHLSLETVNDRSLWVHRKGANAAGAGVPGLIPGSMGTESFQVLGRGNVDSLNSSSHGAGRRWSRSAAMHRISTAKLWADMQGIYFDRGQGRSLRAEAPAAYKDIHRVMRAQNDLVRIFRRLTPVLNYNGGR